METGDPKGALESFGRALELDPSLHAALSNRAMVHYEDADFDAALVDLTRALELAGGDDPDLLYNRGYVHQAAGRLDLAVQDYTRAMELPGADIETVAEQLERCLA
jgi:tetratricopeptide (TPR) repeat protein